MLLEFCRQFLIRSDPAAHLDRHGGDFRVHRLDPHPNVSPVDLAFDGPNLVSARIEDAFPCDHAVKLNHLQRGSINLVYGPFIAALILVFAGGQRESVLVVHCAYTTSHQYEAP